MPDTAVGFQLSRLPFRLPSSLQFRVQQTRVASEGCRVIRISLAVEATEVRPQTHTGRCRARNCLKILGHQTSAGMGDARTDTSRQIPLHQSRLHMVAQTP